MTKDLLQFDDCKFVGLSVFCYFCSSERDLSVLQQTVSLKYEYILQVA